VWSCCSSFFPAPGGAPVKKESAVETADVNDCLLYEKINVFVGELFRSIEMFNTKIERLQG
jgi:hypothetical protein